MGSCHHDRNCGALVPERLCALHVVCGAVLPEIHEAFREGGCTLCRADERSRAADAASSESEIAQGISKLTITEAVMWQQLGPNGLLTQ